MATREQCDVVIVDHGFAASFRYANLRAWLFVAKWGGEFVEWERVHEATMEAVQQGLRVEYAGLG